MLHTINPLRYSEDEIDNQIQAIPPEDGAMHNPTIFDLIMQAYQKTKTDDLLSEGQGGSPLTKSAASPLGRGGATWDESYSTPESAEDHHLNKLKKYLTSPAQYPGN